MKKILTIMALLIAFTVNGFAKDITVYVHSSEQPSIYAWNADGVLTSAFPGNGMAWVYWTSGKGLWKYTFENQSSINVIFSYGGKQTTNIEGVTEDTYYDFNISDGSYQVLVNTSIDKVALPGSFNNWNQSFFLTKGTGNTWTGVIDLTETTADVTFKSIITAGSNVTWLGYTSPGIIISDSNGLLDDDGSDDHNIKLKNSTSDYQTYTVTLTWEENPFSASGWTISVEGKDKRVSYDEIPLTMDGSGLVSTEFDGYNDDVIVKLTISNNTDPYESRSGWGIGLITNIDNWESNDYSISLQGKDGVEFDLFTTVGALKNTAKLGTDEYVAGQYHPEGGVTINVFNNCSLKSISILVPIVSSAKLLGSWDEWGDGLTLTKATDSYEWSGTLDLTDFGSDAAFKLFVNGESWLGSTQVALADGTEDLVSVGAEGSNLTLNNSTSGYATYDVTATWTISGSVASGWTLKVEGVTPRPNADINSVKVVVPNAPIDPFDITNKKEEVDGKYVYSMDMDLSVVTDNIPFYFVVNGTQIPLDNITVEGLLVESPNTPSIGDCIMLMQDNHAVYTATATWTPNPDATANWTMKVVGKDLRPSGTTYSIIYNLTNQADDWKVGDTMTGTEGVFTTTFNNKPGMRFAIAPTGSIGINGIQWNQIIRPKVTSGDFEINYFSNYSDETEVVESGGKVWWIKDDNASGLTLTFNPADNKFTIVSDATTTTSISTAGYATYSMSKPFTVEGAEVYIVTGVASGEANMVRLEGANLEIPAGTGVILKGEAGDYTVKPSFGEGSVAGNLLIGTGESPNGYDITGVYPQEMGGGEYTAYIFANKEPNGVGFYLLDSSNGNTIAPFKAFLAVPKSQTAPDFIGFGDTTGIDATLNDNGQMINDNVIYDLSGRRVMNPTKGLYIINGKKVVIK